VTGRDLGFSDPERERALLIGLIEAISVGPELGPLASHVASLVTDATGTDLCYVYVLDDSGARRRWPERHRRWIRRWTGSGCRWAPG